MLLEEGSIENKKGKSAINKTKTKTQRRKVISSQKSVINNALKLHNKRGINNDAFINKNILPGDLEDVYEVE